MCLIFKMFCYSEQDVVRALALRVETFLLVCFAHNRSLFEWLPIVTDLYLCGGRVQQTPDLEFWVFIRNENYSQACESGEDQSSQFVPELDETSVSLSLSESGNREAWPSTQSEAGSGGTSCEDDESEVSGITA